MSATESTHTKPRPVSPRRGARRLAVQMLYGWLLNPRELADVKADARHDESFDKVDQALFDRLVGGVLSAHEELRALIAPLLDRRIESLSPVEHAILLLAAEELAHHPETPYRVVISEAIELAKTFGGTDGHKYVNGVLDRLASQLRPNDPRPTR
ncbi:MAG: transcription antitermination factor NusB [Betaproteobacteria bacterium]|nr:transcription antitermination factor NusB [Betaproteobacteria bacterium]